MKTCSAQKISMALISNKNTGGSPLGDTFDDFDSRSVFSMNNCNVITCISSFDITLIFGFRGSSLGIRDSNVHLKGCTK